MDRKVKRNGSKFIITDPSLIACSHISELNCKPVSNIKRNIALLQYVTRPSQKTEIIKFCAVPRQTNPQET